MSTNNPFTRAQREQTNVLVSIVGPSGSGKTYSGLLMARGLAGPDGRIAVIDTEKKRAKHFADKIEFDHFDLSAPFAPSRYVELIEAADANRYDVLVIDSDSHEWEGLGGVIEMAAAIEERTGKAGLHCWAKPKREHKRFVMAILQTNMHVICCSRAKEKFVQGRGKDGKTEIVSAGLVAIQEKDFIYEMTIGVMLDREHKAHMIKPCAGIEGRWKDDTPLTVEHGRLLREWANEGNEVDEEFERLLATAQGIAADVDRSFKHWFEGLGKDDREKIRPHIPQLQSAREEAERQAQLGASYVESEPKQNPFNTEDEPDVAGASTINPEALLEQYREVLTSAANGGEIDDIVAEFEPHISKLTEQYQTTAKSIEEGARGRAEWNADQGSLV